MIGHSPYFLLLFPDSSLPQIKSVGRLHKALILTLFCYNTDPNSYGLQNQSYNGISV